MKQVNFGDKYVPVFVLILAGLCTGNAQAEIYKWTDKSGKVHYSDKPSSETAQSVPGTGTSIDTSQAIKALAEKEQDYKKRQEEAAKAKEKSDKEAEQARIKRQNCENARKQMSQLQSSQRLYSTSPYGSRVYLDTAARQQALDNAQKVINENCK